MHDLQGKRDEQGALLPASVGIGSADDMVAAMALFGDALADMPDPLRHSSQQEAFLPAPCETFPANLSQHCILVNENSEHRTECCRVHPGGRGLECCTFTGIF